MSGSPATAGSPRLREIAITALAATRRPLDSQQYLLVGLLLTLLAAALLAAPRVPAALAGLTAPWQPVAAPAALGLPAVSEAAPLTHQFFIPSLNRGSSPARIAQELRERQDRLMRLAFPERFPQTPTDPRQHSPLLPVIDAPVPALYRAPAPPSISPAGAKQTEREAAQQSRSLAALAARGVFDRLFEPSSGAGLAGITVLPGAPTRAGPVTALGY